jgi:hypothetical protein
VCADRNSGHNDLLVASLSGQLAAAVSEIHLLRQQNEQIQEEGKQLRDEVRLLQTSKARGDESLATFSEILSADAEWFGVLQSWLPGRRFELLFRASRDGWAAADFHRLCDDRGPTVVLVRTTGGWIIGGYAAASWNSSGNCYQSPNNKSFLFALKNSNGNDYERTQYPFKPSSNEFQKNELFGHSNWGPWFGYEEFCISNYANSNTASMCGKKGGAQAYQSFSFGIPGSKFDLKHNFQASDYEVFSVQ